MGARIMILAGGTGGHIFPALAVAEELIARGHQVSWMGTLKGMESRLVPAAHIPVDWLSVGGLRGKGMMTLFKAPLMLAMSCWQAFKILRQRKPQVVLGMGGFVAGPGGLMATLMRIPLVIHEQNRIPGTTNRLLSRIATRVLEAFPGTFEASFKATTTGNPLRKNLVAEVVNESKTENLPVRLLVLGGSQGAKALNETIPDAIKQLDFAIDVRHQSGERLFEETQKRYAEAGIQASVEPFIADMIEAYHWADFVICRSGAMTVSELAAMGKPAVLVPFPQAIDDHQTRNAMYLVDGGAARILPQSELTETSLANAIKLVAKDKKQLESMANAAKALARVDATQVVADHCLAEVRS